LLRHSSSNPTRALSTAALQAGDDLCLALRAESILIERMPGNRRSAFKYGITSESHLAARGIEAPEFIGGKSKITLSLGKDINGRIVVADSRPCRTC